MQQNQKIDWSFVPKLLQALHPNHNAKTVQLFYSITCRVCHCMLAVWDPFFKKDIELLEGILKFGLKVMCSKSWNCSYEAGREFQASIEL
jgi:hypothetical protein